MVGIVFGIVAAGTAGGMGLLINETQADGPYRQVTIKVAAYPSETSNVSTDDVTHFEDLENHEKKMFLHAVEEADTAFEESSMRFSTDTAKHVFTNTKAVEYGGAVYPVFVVENEIVNPQPVSVMKWAFLAFVPGFIIGMLAELVTPAPRRY